MRSRRCGPSWRRVASTIRVPGVACTGITPWRAWGGLHGHHTLAAALASGDDPSLPALFDQLNQSGADTILLSSEVFAKLDEAGVRRLHALMEMRRPPWCFTAGAGPN